MIAPVLDLQFVAPSAKLVPKPLACVFHPVRVYPVRASERAASNVIVEVAEVMVTVSARVFNGLVYPLPSYVRT